ncbi:MAG TPA: histidinol dehydrogenase [Elusimicrobiota bacterium]|nr:histidinol dehydrogenase [Elusimicrobiota bacterium]
MKILDWDGLPEAERAAALRRPTAATDEARRKTVAAIMADVRSRGDAAVRDYTQRFDRADVVESAVPQAELDQAWEECAADVREALTSAAARIEAFHRAQAPAAVSLETSPGIACERRWVPLDTVGLYAPGGSAPLVSTVLMVGIPARLAGCRRRVLATPPGPDGRVDARLLAAAKLAGITQVVRAGGAQGIAALAYGTETVPKCDKIFGPGNSWVAEAKRQAAEDPEGAAQDLPAGPSEVLVIADDSANPVFVAADLLAQAEHGEDSQVLLGTPSRVLLDVVKAELDRQLATLPRAKIASAALAHALLAVTKDLDQALELSERYAPEHLILQTKDDESLAARVRRAGAVFLGPWAPEAAGDYASGPNHVLPTGGAARAFGGLGLESFLRPVTFQRLTRGGLKALATDVEVLAKVEGLDAHGRSVTMRAA